MASEEQIYAVPILETERLLLLPWKVDYAEDMFELQCKINSYSSYNSEKWAIGLKNETGFKIIGQIAIRTRTEYKEFDFYKEITWYMIADKYQGNGYCTEAVTKILHFAFIGLNCDGIYIYHRYFNNKSRKVIERSGFQLKSIDTIGKKGEFPQPMARCDYTMSKADYIALHDIVDVDEERKKYYFDLKLVPIQAKKSLKKIKESPYSFEKPIRKIDSISYVKAPTKSLSAHWCVAMLAGVSVDEVIKLIGEREGITKQDLKKVLDYYGIRYATNSSKYDPKVPLPNLCIIRMLMTGYMHWEVYFDGVYYDPEFGILKEFPQNSKTYQVWEIYP